MYQTEKSLKEMGDKVDAADRQRIEDKLAALKKALEGTDMEAVKRATEETSTVSYEVFGQGLPAGGGSRAGRGRVRETAARRRCRPATPTWWTRRL